jgi:serine/threonine protein kinase
MKPLAQNTLIQNRYLIVHLIGKGGMGEVYLAVDQRLGSAVALKRTFFAGDEMLGNAFEREARTLARMRHPVLPKVSDHFSENDEQFLVMEHIAGDDLAKRLEMAQKPFPLSWVLFWADQLLDALSYLHTHEPPIIHRDIKPQNLKLTDENHIILLDFGLSKTSTGQTNISQSGSTGSVVGYTPHYAPMEQIRGIGTSARSDIYSLSATLYQLMTNSVPADALSRADAMLNELPDPIEPPHLLNPEVPKVLSDVILKGMEVSQEKRYPTAREMQKVLRKTFSDMQKATTAETVAFRVNKEQSVAIEQPAPAGAGNLEMGETPRGASVPEPESARDLNATIAYEQPPVPSVEPAVQADVRTELFAGTSNPFPAPPIESIPTAGPRSAEADSQSGSSSASAPAPEGPAVDIGNETIPYFDPTEVETIAAGNGGRAAAVAAAAAGLADTGGGGRSSSLPPPTPRAQPSPVQPRKASSGKLFAVLGGVAALLLVGAAVAGGAYWYYVNNYAAVIATDPQPSPSPVAAPTAETIQEPVLAPSPEPTVEPEPAANSDVNQQPRTSETGPPAAQRPGNSAVPRPSPGQRVVPQRTPATRPTPKTGDDRTRILQ